METKIQLYQKLLQIQGYVNGLAKDKKSNTYNYVSGNKLLGYIRPKMTELGLILKQEVIGVENTRQNYTLASGKEKSEILSKVTMRFTWIDTATGATDENLFGANGQNDWEKGLGSALTYAERYFLLKYFHIPTDEDDIDNPERKKASEANVSTAHTPLPEQPQNMPGQPQQAQAKARNVFFSSYLSDENWVIRACQWLEQSECAHGPRFQAYGTIERKFSGIQSNDIQQIIAKYNEYKANKSRSA